jgi:Protein of unknown function (DUF3574)
MLLSRIASAAALAIALTGCASVHRHACSSGEPLSVQDSLYFGTARPTGVVTPEEWAEFLQGTVTPRFPQGLTVWLASGQWRGADGAVVREASHVLVLIHPYDVASENAVLEIMAAYKAHFQQEAVLRVKADVCPSF